MEENNENEREEAKKKLAEKLKNMRIHSMQQSQRALRVFQRKPRYRFTRGGKTKRA
ncbi:MAG: hypothetical protein AABX17_03340 [Nanoarchaeota archaeon]